ncbi:hypothetical protein SteCoe_18507 [Stentor coeruleus]|uniref:Tyrosine-protein phosphatase domain-containing protein n=1 Tax=Stentor coeruleus TaxID=5963 RepID=A0A1R2BWW6_9CILI|nr:hypothetical protein SteCoe_18507 [Stentor coeruleus]
MDSVLVGAFKVKDGLFIGDEFAAQDLEFVVANKVTRIINCAARQVPNHWEPIGVHYLSYPWFDNDNQIILDSSDKNFNTIFTFIEHGLETGESILLHSVRGVSRCVCVVTAYLIRKYQWSLYKALDFIAFRRPDLDLNPAFLTQLSTFEARLVRNSKLPRTDQWDQVLENGEELVLRNTFINARLGEPTDYHMTKNDATVPSAIKWQENVVDISSSAAKNKVESGYAIIQSCMKGRNKTEQKVPLINIESIKEKSLYNRINFGKGVKAESDDKQKNRSSSLNRNENRLVKEAITAARNMIDIEPPRPKQIMRGSATSKDSKRPEKEDFVIKVVRPTTAPQKRPPSPRVADKIKMNNSVKNTPYGLAKKKK